MEISPVLLAKLLFYSFLLGLSAGMFYDAHRVVRAFFGIDCIDGKDSVLSWKLPFISKRISVSQGKSKKRFFKDSVILVGDLTTLLFVGLGLLILNYSYNDGDFRFFTVLGALFGFLAYLFTVGRLTKYVLSATAFFLKYCFCAFFVILGYPFKYFLDFVTKFVRKIFFLFKIRLEKRNKRVYNIYEKVCLADLAKNGFIKLDGVVSRDSDKSGEESKGAYKKE